MVRQLEVGTIEINTSSKGIEDAKKRGTIYMPQTENVWHHFDFSTGAFLYCRPES